MASLVTTALCSAASHPAVKLSPAEVAILAKGGFQIENDTYSADPAVISAKAQELLGSVNEGYTSLVGKVSYHTGFGSVGKNSELAQDLEKVAADVQARGREGSNAEAPTAPAGTTAKVQSFVAKGVSLVSHTAASYVGKTYRTV